MFVKGLVVKVPGNIKSARPLMYNLKILHGRMWVMYRTPTQNSVPAKTPDRYGWKPDQYKIFFQL